VQHDRVNPSVAATRAPARALARAFSAPIFWTISVLVAAVAVGSVSMAGAARAATGPEDFADMADALVPAVVNISTAQVAEPGASPFPRFPPGSPFQEFFKDFFERRGEKGEKEDKGEEPEQQPRPRATSLGSGFVIDPDGYIVTNNHVIADADEITVIFSDDTTLKAVLIGRDPKTDLALLKVDSEKPLVAVEWGDSDAARVGHWVLAIGNPFGLGSTVTAGIISARARDINAGPFDDYLQTDAAINRGNSGGPLFNMDSQVIGINTAIYSPSGGSVGIGFSVPANLAKNVIHQLREFGETRRGWLGVRIQTVTEDLAESLGLDDARGALVASVTEGSPAADGGLRVGDVVVRFNGRDVTTMRRLPRIVAETRIGEVVEVDLWRDRRLVTVEVEIGRLDESDVKVASARPPADKPAVADVPELGLTLSAITPELREKFELGENVNGVMVVRVKTDSMAAKKGIRPGDVIVEVGQEEVSTPEDVIAKVGEQRAQNKNTVLLLLDRKGDLQFIAVRLEDS
jgi:serine protease Do